MDISLIVSGNMIVRLKHVDLNILLDAIYEKFLPKCKAKNLEFIKQIPDDNNINSLICDDSLLRKALSHLLDNAIKFTNNGSVVLGFSIVKGEYEIFVKDTGSGISLEAQDTVFQIFMQEEVSDVREYEGSGLGLSIAKGMVELMGGKIRIKSVKGKGSTVFIVFHAEPVIIGKTASSEPPIVIDHEPELQTVPVVLVAEDNGFNSSFYKIILERASYKYLRATNGVEAVEMCRNHPEISIVLMDIKMPVMDGLQATRKIREFRQNLPIISVTALATMADKEKALEAGCNEYLTKPVNISLLLTSIDNLLKKYVQKKPI
jgi:CheY-like chemotaxis protein/anti-sigma regulatory factor (Ser/Thr protein kinase)